MKRCPKCEKHYPDEARYCVLDAVELIPVRPRKRDPSGGRELDDKRQSPRVEFKFHFIVEGQSAAFFRSSRGVIADDHVLLADTPIPYSDIGDTVTRGKRLALQVLSSSLEGKATKHLTDSLLVVEPKDIAADRLEMLIDQRCSAVRLAAKREIADEMGVSNVVRSHTCPSCRAAIDLTGYEPARYVYCPYCDSISDSEQGWSLGGEYRTCDECGLFGRVQSYPEYYFYFLLIVYGFSYKHRFLCDSCAGRLFWKALLLNALFLVGVPTALWVKVKSLIGRQHGMKHLDRANKLARKGQLRDATPLYESVRRQYPEHPGVLFNEGVTRLQHGDQEGGGDRLSRALAACPNYYPLLRLLRPAS